MRLTNTLFYILITTNLLIAQGRIFTYKFLIDDKILDYRETSNHEHTYILTRK